MTLRSEYAANEALAVSVPTKVLYRQHTKGQSIPRSYPRPFLRRLLARVF